MEIHKRMRMDHTKVIVLTQMGIEIPEDMYNDFLENLERDGYIDVATVVMNNKNKVTTVNIRIFKAEG
jgi:vacuolar-type H+-ATPase subunit B/Vma2